MLIKAFAFSTTAALAAVLLTAGCASTPSAATPPSTPSSSASVSSAVQRLTLTVANGKVTGDTGRIKVKLGSVVRLVVTSDVADEVHVHTYDKHLDLAVGQTGTLTFTANIPAIVEIELERSKLLLTRLQVS